MHLADLLGFVLHFDDHLQSLIGAYGAWVYGILFLIIFCETGLVIAPFLPGDSLLFAAGAIAATGSLNAITLIIILSIASILGDAVNYQSGRWIGEHVFTDNARILKKQYLHQAHRLFAQYGPRAIVLARFMPFARTFVPFVAGAGRMHFTTFTVFNVIGGIAWATGFILLGYFFGNLPFVRDHFEVVVLGIVFVSCIPAAMEMWRARRKKS